MENFRKKVERRFKLDTLVCLCSLALYFMLVFLTNGASDIAQAVSMGVFVGMESFAVYSLTRTFAALRNEKKLKEMYINETDERNIAINKETSQKSSAISMMGTAMAAVAAGFFDEKICFSLVAVLLFSALATVIVNVYYKRKM